MLSNSEYIELLRVNEWLKIYHSDETKGLFYVLMAIVCYAGENAYAALSTMLLGLLYAGTAYLVL